MGPSGGVWHVEDYDLEMVKCMNEEMQEKLVCFIEWRRAILWSAANEYMQGIECIELIMNERAKMFVRNYELVSFR